MNQWEKRSHVAVLLQSCFELTLVTGVVFYFLLKGDVVAFEESFFVTTDSLQYVVII